MQLPGNKINFNDNKLSLQNYLNYHQVYSTEDYCTVSKNSINPTTKLSDLTQSFLDRLQYHDNFKKIYSTDKKVLTILINEKKVVLQSIYVNFFEHLKKYTNLTVNVEYIDDLKPGAFTNHNQKSIYTDGILLIYTKNHNKKEQRILDEILETSIDINLITVNTPITIRENFSKLHNNRSINVVEMTDIKSLYWFTFSFDNLLCPVAYKDFCIKNSFMEEKYDFKNATF